METATTSPSPNNGLMASDQNEVYEEVVEITPPKEMQCFSFFYFYSAMILMHLLANCWPISSLGSLTSALVAF